MPTLSVILELLSRGGASSRRELEEAAKGPDALRAAAEKADAAFKKIPRTLRAVDAAAAETRGNLEGVAGRLGVVGEAASAIGPAGTLAAAAAVGIGTAVTALHAMARGAADAAGEVVDLSDLTGVSTTTLQSYRIAAAGAGVGQEAFNKAIQTFAKNAGDAELGTGKLSGKLKALDPDFLQLVNNATSVEQKFDLVIGKLNELPAGAERAALATAAFGAEGAKLVNVGASVDEVADRYRALNAVISDDSLRAADAAGDALDEVTTVLGQQIAALETEAAPAILGFEKQWVSGAIRIASAIHGVLVEIGLINQSLDQSFTELSTRRAALSSELAQINRDTGRGLETTSSSERRKDIEAEIAALEHWQKAIRDKGKTDKEVSDAEAAGLKRQHELRLGELAEIRAQEKLQAEIDAKKKKGASEAEAAQKRATEAHKRGLEEVMRLEQDAQTAGLDGVAKLEAEREVAYAKFAELVKEDGLNQEEAARGYLAIWTAADREITAEREKEADKRAAAAQREADKQSAAAKKEADKTAEAFEKPFDNAIEGIQSSFADMFANVFENGLDGAADFGDQLKHLVAQLAGELGGLLVIQPILGAITGQGGGGINLSQIFGGSSASSGSSSGFLTRFLNGLSDLGSNMFGLGSELAANTNAITDWTQAVPYTGVDPTTGAGFTGAVDPGAGAFPDISTPGVGGGGAGVSGAAAAGIIAGIIGAVMGTTGALDSLRRGQRFAFDQSDVVELLNKGAIKNDPFGLARIVGADRVTRGVLEDNPSAVDRSIAAVITIGTSEIVRLAGLTPQPPTGGTAARAHFEKRAEGVTDFFRDNSFNRSLGQDFARSFVEQGRGEFRQGVLEYARQSTEDVIGLTPIQSSILQAAAGVARADLGDKIGSEPQRFGALYATLAGNLAEGGADFVASLTAAKQILDSYGPPPRVFDIFNDFVTSKDNDIVLEDQLGIVKGLGAAFFSDLIPAEVAARIAVKDFQETGELSFRRIQKQVLAAAAEFQHLKPLIMDLGAAVAAAPDDFFANGIVKPSAIQDFKDSFSEAVRDSVVQGFLDATLNATFEPLFAPIFADQQQIVGDLNAGKITPEEAATRLAGVGQRLSDSLDDLDPVITQTVKNVAKISTAFRVAGDNADDAANEIADAQQQAADGRTFTADVRRGILGHLSPELADEYDVEVAARQRLFRARELGLDLADVEELNDLERNAVVEKYATQRTDIEERAQDQISRIWEQFYDGVAQNLEALRDYAESKIASPSSPYAPASTLPNATARLDALLAAAEGGDASALDKIPQAFDDFEAIARQMYGSTADFFALFAPRLERLQALGETDPHEFRLTAGEQAQIDAINADRDAQLATLDKHHDEAMALWQKMLDALLINAEGFDISRGGGSGPDDVKTVPIVGGTAGQFGLTEQESRLLQPVLGSAKKGGAIQLDVRAMIAHGDVLDGVYGPLIGQLFEGAISKHGRHAVLVAFDEKIEHPEKFQPVLGFRNEGAAEVIGPAGYDRVPVSFMASAGEHLYVTTASLTDTIRSLGNVIINGDQREERALRELVRFASSIDGRLQTLEDAARSRAVTPRVPQ